MRAAVVLLLIAICTGITACGSDDVRNRKGSSADWNSRFVVWEGRLYSITKESVQRTGAKLGTVSRYSDEESERVRPGATFSNYFPKGTEIYAVDGTEAGKSIAVRSKNGGFVRLDSQGEYPFS